MTETISKLMEANLLGVFNERDAQRRALAIESTYAADVRWTDDEGVVLPDLRPRRPEQRLVAGVAVHQDQVEHFGPRIHFYRAGTDLVFKRLISSKQQLLTGLPGSIKSSLYLCSAE